MVDGPDDQVDGGDEVAGELVAEVEAWLRAEQFGELLIRYVGGQLVPLVNHVLDQGGDVRAQVLEPTAELLRRIADRLEHDIVDLDGHVLGDDPAGA
jgi:hypothetical protein